MRAARAASATLQAVPTKKAVVRIDYELLRPANVAAAVAGLTLEAWLNRAIAEALKREGADTR